MRVTRILGGVLLSAFIAAGSVAHAGGFRMSAASGPRDYSVKSGWVVRSALPANSGKTAAARIKVLLQSMEDEIEGTGHFKNDADTPAFEIVSHGPTLKEVASAGYAGSNLGSNNGVAKYQVKASDLQNGKLDVTVLLPVSGHVGLSSAQNYAQSNVFRLKNNNGAWENVKATGTYVTQVKRTLSLKSGLNEVQMEPYAGGFGGYSQGRTVQIEVVP